MEISASRREFMAGALAFGLSPKPNKAAGSRPNVLYVLCDEWRAQATGYAGDTNALTPTLDRFAQSSVNFSQTISSLPVCCPHRASLMTGQYSLTNGVFINDVPLEPKGVTLGEAFRHAGYSTGYIGKWHIYGSPDGNYGRRLSYIPPDKRFGFEYWKVCECTHDYNHSLYYEDDDRTAKYWLGYDAIAQTADACAFIERHQRADEPFFLLLSMGPPHFPYETAPAQYRALYADRKIDLRANVPANQRDAAIRDLRGYYAHIAALDDCMKRILETLERSGLAENTVVVFTSDHGDMMSSQGLTTKTYPWEESARVPFLLRYPRGLGTRGRELSVLFNTPDIMPTLLGLAEITIPAGVQGRDYSGPLLGRTVRNLPTSAFMNMPASFAAARQYGIDAYRGVRTHTRTYVRSIHGPWLLYDNRRDPYQMHNLCGQPAARDTQAALERELQSWLARLGDEFLPGEVYLQRAGLTHYEEVNSPIGVVSSPWGDWRSTLPSS